MVDAGSSGAFDAWARGLPHTVSGGRCLPEASRRESAMRHRTGSTCSHRCLPCHGLRMFFLPTMCVSSDVPWEGRPNHESLILSSTSRGTLWAGAQGLERVRPPADGSSGGNLAKASSEESRFRKAKALKPKPGRQRNRWSGPKLHVDVGRSG